MGGKVKTKVVPGISDHEAVFGSIHIPKPTVQTIKRDVFLYSKANWRSLSQAIENFDWKVALNCGADSATEVFTRELMRLVEQFIPKRTVTEEKREHPWLTERCRQAVARKRAAAGTSDFPKLRDECADELRAAYNYFVAETRRRLLAMPAGSRDWWKVAKDLMSLSAPREVIPPLIRADGTWAKTGTEKAELFAQTFRDKSKLEDEEINQRDYSYE